MDQENKSEVENQSSGSVKRFKKKTALVILLIIGAIVAVLGALYFLPADESGKSDVQGAVKTTYSLEDPKPNDYSDKFIEKYNQTCIKESQNNGVNEDKIAQDYCKCTLEQITLNYTEDEYTKIERNLKNNPESAPDKLIDLLTICYKKYIPAELIDNTDKNREQN